MAKIDVVMPVRDGAGTLAAAIRSILWQSERDLRLLIIDDGSGPAARAVIAGFVAHDPRVVAVPAEGSGIVDALNTGLDRADAPYVARMDGDDIALPTRFAAQLGAMEARPALVLCGTPVIRFGAARGVAQVPHDPAACARALRVFNCFYHPTVMIRRAALVTHGIRYARQDELAEDFRLFGDLAAVGETMNLAAPHLLYRIHSGQLSRTRKAAQDRAALDVVRRRAGLAQGRGADLRAIAGMARAAVALGPSHARRSLNALRNAAGAMLR